MVGEGGGGSVARLWDAGFWVDLRKGPSSLCCFVVLLKVYWYNGTSNFQHLQGTISTIDVPTDWASADPYVGEYPMTSYLYPLLTHTSLLLTVSDQAKGSDPTWSSWSKSARMKDDLYYNRYIIKIASWTYINYTTSLPPIPLLFARQSSHFICFSPSPCRLEHVCLTSLGRGSLAQFGQDHSQAERFDRGIGHGTNWRFHIRLNGIGKDDVNGLNEIESAFGKRIKLQRHIMMTHMFYFVKDVIKLGFTQSFDLSLDERHVGQYARQCAFVQFDNLLAR